MGLPVFLGIGAQKSATTWLHQMLKQHPNVWLPPLKELHFFDNILSDTPTKRAKLADVAAKKSARGAAKGADPAWIAYLDRISQLGVRSDDWYREIFSWEVADDVKKGEITPAYIDISAEAVAYARNMLGPVKIILIVRKPLDRELSQLRMWAQRRDEDKAPRTVQDWKELHDEMQGISARGSYSQGVPLWQAAFPDTFLALPFGDIRDNPRATMDLVEEFLGIPHFTNYGKLDEKVHKSKKAEIPAEFVEMLAARTAREDDFIKSHFGEDFYLRTK